MADLAILVIDDPEKTDEVLTAWREMGVSGATILDSTGMARRIGGLGAPDDLPLIPSLSSLFASREEPHRTLITVLPDDFDVNELVRVTEIIIGRLDDPHTGILFTVPVKQVWGLVRRTSEKKP